MTTPRPLILFFIGMVLLVNGAQAKSYFGPAIELGIFTPSECEFNLPKVLQNHTQCGTVVVPDTHFGEQAGIFKLRVMRLKAHVSSSLTPSEPLLYLHGGPGGRLLGAMANDTIAPYILRHLSHAAPNRDIILFEQRGVESVSRVNECYDTTKLLAFRRKSIDTDFKERLSQALVDCTQAYSNLPNHDLKAFRVKEYAADVEMIRQALSIDEWSLYASSYASEVVSMLLDTVPQRINKVVLDSPVGAQQLTSEGNFMAFVEALERVFVDCEANEACSKQYPKLRKRFFKAYASLNKRPLKLTSDVLDPHFYFDGDRFVGEIKQMLYQGVWVRAIPRTIMAASRRDKRFLKSTFSAITAEQSSILGPLPEDDPHFQWVANSDLVSLPVNLAYRCNERAAFSEREQKSELVGKLASTLYDGQVLFPDTEKMCVQLNLLEPASTAVARRKPWQNSALILHGDYDPLLSQAYVQQMAQQFVNPEVARFKAQGHGVSFSSHCAFVQLSHFLANRITQDDDYCEALKQPTFATKNVSGYTRVNVSRSSISVMFPAGWSPVVEGKVYARFSKGDVYLTQDAMVGDKQDVLRYVVSAGGIEAGREDSAKKVGSREAQGLQWQLYFYDRQNGWCNYIAVMNNPNGPYPDRTYYVVYTLADSAKAAKNYDKAFLAAIDRYLLL